MKSFTPPPPFKFLFLFVIAVSLFTGLKAEAMPEGQGLIARFYPGWEAISRKESDLFNFTRNFMSDYEGYAEKYRVKVRQEIQDVYNITSFDQELAVKEIGQLIDSKKLPNYLLEKGQYKYDGNINSVYFLNEFELRSQPNPEARVIDQGYGGHQENYFAIATYSYLGEWTHPNGAEWIIIKDDDAEIGFAPKKEAEAHFVTNEQLKSFANVLEILAVAGEAALLEKERLDSWYTTKINELQQQLQAAQRQAQQNQRQVQQAQQQVYQCSKCGERAVTSSAAKLPSGPCYNEKGKWSMLGRHMWNRLQ